VAVKLKTILFWGGKSRMDFDETCFKQDIFRWVGPVTPFLISMNILLALFRLLTLNFDGLYTVYPNLNLIIMFYVIVVGSKPFAVNSWATKCLQWIPAERKK
jgi:hypothetical protein